MVSSTRTSFRMLAVLLAGARRLMTKQSRRTIGGFEAFKRESSARAEGWGAWAKARRRAFEVRVITPMGDDAASVVTMTGKVAQEDPSEVRR